MTDTEIWEYDDLTVTDEGYVEGYAYTRMKGGYDVQVTVTSYEYERRGETRMNHVPNVVVTDAGGAIQAEPSAYDSDNPTTAIENGKGAAEYVFKHLTEFVQ